MLVLPSRHAQMDQSLTLAVRLLLLLLERGGAGEREAPTNVGEVWGEEVALRRFSAAFALRRLSIGCRSRPIWRLVDSALAKSTQQTEEQLAEAVEAVRFHFPRRSIVTAPPAATSTPPHPPSHF